MNTTKSTPVRRRTASAAYSPSTPRKRVLSDAELATVWPALGASAMAPRTRLVLQLTLTTAQRHGELRHIQPRHLALDGPEPMTLEDYLGMVREATHRPLARTVRCIMSGRT